MTNIHPKPTPEQEFALDLLRSESSFLLVGHMRPDGDCVGSQAALARVLKSLGKEVSVLNPDAVDSVFERITEGVKFETFAESTGVPEHAVCVLLDINSLSRCGAMEKVLAAAPSKKLVIDHHVSTVPVHQDQAQLPGAGGSTAAGQHSPWWDAAFIDVTAAATGVLVARVAALLGVPLEPLAAEAIFTAIVTDTGWFKYSNTDAETMSLAGQLVSQGVVPNEIYGRTYERDAPEIPAAMAAVLGCLRYHCGGRLAVISHPLDSGPGAHLEAGDAVLDVVRAVEQVEVVLYLREIEEGVCKLSARSKTDFDVNALAGIFGGGGHKKASGATILGTLPEVGSRITEAASAMLGESETARPSVGGSQ